MWIAEAQVLVSLCFLLQILESGIADALRGRGFIAASISTVDTARLLEANALNVLRNDERYEELRFSCYS
jgi:hypothetical protein